MKTKAHISTPLEVAGQVFSKKTTSQHKEFIKSKQYKPVVAKTAFKEITMFLVDDDLMYLKALEHSISNKLSSVKIKTFQTGEACLQQMKMKPDIVVLDYNLSSALPYAWNGLDILKQIRKLNRKTKVIMLSSQDSLDVAINCGDNGSYDYITKSESAFIRINNVITNIIDDMETNEKSMKPYQIVSIIMFIILLLSILFNL
jgi:two-component system OmpR family response regulator